jgi:hypothetical protein
MQENSNAKGDSAKSDKNSKRTPHAWLRWILVAGAILFVALLFGSVFIPNLTERVKFFTANALSLSVLVAIIVQVYIYRRQWQMMERQNDIAQQNMIYAQRAYVTITDGVVAFIVGEGDGRFRMRVKNSGNTPAYAVQVEAEVEVQENGVRKTQEEGPVTITQLGIIAPEHHYFCEVPRPYGERGPIRLYCRGMITYQDIFGEIRHTRFCLAQGRFNEQGLTQLIPCQTGNEAIDESEEKKAN